MGRDFVKNAKGYFNAGSADKWCQVFKEFVGSMLVVLVASQSSDAGFGAFRWGIAFVVMSILCGKDHHLNSWVTLYRLFTGAMCNFQAVLYLGAQFLGAFVAAKLAGALSISADSYTSFDSGKWRDGIQEAIAIHLFLWMFNHARSDKDTGMPRNIFLIAATGVCFFFHANFNFSYNRVFTSCESITASWALLCWGLLAVVVTHVKAKLCNVESKWFWESDSEEPATAEEKEAVVESEA